MKIPNIPHALENIDASCRLALTKLYPAGIPDPVKERYETEYQYLAHSEYVDDFELYRLFSLEAKKNCSLLLARGTLTASFIYFLLGESFNPLPSYYYCPNCGYYEEGPSHTFGIDLPRKKCPHCETQISPTGFNLPIESVWGTDGQKTIAFEYDVNDDFMPFASRVISAAYPENSVAARGMFELEPGTIMSIPSNRSIRTVPAGYVILPSGNTIEDYSDLLSYLEDGTPCLVGGSHEMSSHLLKSVHLSPWQNLNRLLSLQRATGIYANEITNDDLRTISWHTISNSAVLSQDESMLFQDFKPKTFWEMSNLIAVSHNSFFSHTDNENNLFVSFYEIIRSDSFKKYPCCTREDFFDFLKECDIDPVLAFEISERIRKGQANSPGDRLAQFEAFPIPDDLKNVARNYRYVFPRAHCVTFLILYARIAYYFKNAGRVFSRITFRKN